MNVVIFRENTEDVYSGIEWKSGTPEVKKLIEFLNDEMLGGGPKQIREDSGIGIKPMSPFGTKRLVRRAIRHAVENKRRVVTLVHKGNIRNSPKAHSAIGATNWPRRNFAPKSSPSARAGSWTIKTAIPPSPSNKTPP